MALLIDGYNLIHAAGIVGRGRGPGGLERSRWALLNFIVESLEHAELRRTVVVFDAAGAPPNLPASIEHRGLRVRFSRGYPSADDLLEELIQADTAPRQLTVVSSDHRLHRAARRRRAQAIDADRWYEAVLRRRRAAHADRAGTATTATTVEGKQESRPASPEIEYWLRQFVVEDEPKEAASGGPLDQPHPTPHRGPSPPASKKPQAPPAASPAAADEPRRRAPRRIRGTRRPERRDRRELDSGPIFPPDYGADLAE